MLSAAFQICSAAVNKTQFSYPCRDANPGPSENTLYIL